MIVLTQKPQPVKNLQTQQREWFLDLLGNTDIDDSNFPDLKPFRINARQALETLPVLNRKQEAWRYNRIEKIFKKKFDTTLEKSLKKDHDKSKRIIEQNFLPQLNSYQLVFENGVFNTVLSNANNLPAGVTFMSLAAAMSEKPEQLSSWFSATDQHNDQLFNALNNALFTDGVYLHIDPFIALDRPLEIIYLNTRQTSSIQHDGSLIQTRNIFDLSTGASASLIEYFISEQNNQRYFYNNLSEIRLADDVNFEHTRIQEESRAGYHLSSLFVTQHQHSHYYSNNFSIGATWAKTDYTVKFAEPLAECVLRGLYAVGDQQLSDFHLDVQHSVPSCLSREQFKGFLYGKGRAVFDGRILVNKQAQHSDAALTNDNLILVNDAEVDTKPQLEIYADDVKCSHGTTVGRLDPEQIFYLRSRGIAEDNAKRMLCQGFSAEIIDSITQLQVRDYVTEKIANTLKEDRLASVGKTP